MKPVPIKGFTPLDLGKYADLIARVLVGPNLDDDVVSVLGADHKGRPYAEVMVRLVGRPPLRITIREVEEVIDGNAERSVGASHTSRVGNQEAPAGDLGWPVGST